MWAAQCECWKPNSDPLDKQTTALASSDLFPRHAHGCFWLIVCRYNVPLSRAVKWRGILGMWLFLKASRQMWQSQLSGSFWESPLSSGCWAAASYSLCAWSLLVFEATAMLRVEERARGWVTTPPCSLVFLRPGHFSGINILPVVGVSGSFPGWTWPFSHGSDGVCGGADSKAPLHPTGSASASCRV